MSNRKIVLLVAVLLVIVVSQSGCALLQIPTALINGTFSILGKLLGIAQKLPMPPPGVFGN